MSSGASAGAAGWILRDISDGDAYSVYLRIEIERSWISGRFQGHKIDVCLRSSFRENDDIPSNVEFRGNFVDTIQSGLIYDHLALILGPNSESCEINLHIDDPVS